MSDEKQIVYQAAYTDCIYESAFAAISIHRTRAGAESAINKHKAAEELEVLERFNEIKKDDPDWDDRWSKIQDWQQWKIIEIELQD